MKTNVLLTVVPRKHINSCELSLAIGIKFCKPGLVNHLCLKDEQAVQYRHILKPENRLFSLTVMERKKSKTKPMTVTLQQEKAERLPAQLLALCDRVCHVTQQALSLVAHLLSDWMHTPMHPLPSEHLLALIMGSWCEHSLTSARDQL